MPCLIIEYIDLIPTPSSLTFGFKLLSNFLNPQLLPKSLWNLLLFVSVSHWVKNGFTD